MSVPQHLLVYITFTFKRKKPERPNWSLSYLVDTWQHAAFLSCVELCLTFQKAVYRLLLCVVCVSISIFVGVFAQGMSHVCWAVKCHACSCKKRKRRRGAGETDGQESDRTWGTRVKKDGWRSGGKTAKGQSRWPVCNRKRHVLRSIEAGTPVAVVFVSAVHDYSEEKFRRTQTHQSDEKVKHDWHTRSDDPVSVCVSVI